MYCVKCGKRIADGVSYCNYCGAKQAGASARPEPANFGGVQTNNAQGNNLNAPVDRGGIGWWLLGFITSWIAIILFVIWHDQYPKRSKSILSGFIASIIIGVIVSVLFFIFMPKIMEWLLDRQMSQLNN